MPIDGINWNTKDEIQEYSDKVYDFLNKNYPKAYSFSEISEAIEYQTKNKSKDKTIVFGFDFAFWASIVKKLEKEGKIESKNIEGKTYYKVKK